MEKQIELISFFPHSTHIMQPLDTGFFHPFKVMWKKIVQKWKVENNKLRLRKKDFANVVELTLNAMQNESLIIKNAFKASGLYPFNPDALDYNLLVKKSKKTLQSAVLSNSAVSTSSNIINSEDQTYLNTFEKTLPPDLLKQFLSCESKGQWTGTIQNSGLFGYWLDIKRRWISSVTSKYFL